MRELVSISKPLSFDTGTATYGTQETLVGLRYRHARRKPLRTMSRTGVEHQPPAPTQLRFLAKPVGPAGHIPTPGRADQNAARALAARGLGTCVYDPKIKARVVGFIPNQYGTALIPTTEPEKLPEWLVAGVATGVFNVMCDECGSACTARYYVLRHRDNARAQINVGADCATKLAGTRTPTLLAAPTTETTTDLPDWMC